VFAGVQDAHERPDHCLLADDAQDLFTDTSMVFAKDRHVRVVVGQRERVKVNKYGEKCRRAGAFFQLLVLEARSGAVSKTTANIIEKHAMLAGHRMGSDPMFLHRRWLQKLSIKVQVLNANLVTMLFSLDGPEWVVKPRCLSSSCSLFLREAGRYSARLLRLCTITVFIH
jgi:hypothetical protein